MSISEAISNLKPEGTGFIIYAEDLNRLEWFNPTEQMPTHEEIIAEAERINAAKPAKAARQKRDKLLADTDWVTIRATDTGNPVPIDWQTYRQALRDITAQAGFPDTIDWPVKPEE